MRAGRLRHVVTLEQQATSRNEYGENLGAWSTVETLRAAIEPVTGRESLAAGQDMATQDVRIFIRYCDHVTPQMRINNGGTIYEIKSVINRDMRNREIELICARGEQSADHPVSIGAQIRALIGSVGDFWEMDQTDGMLSEVGAFNSLELSVSGINGVYSGIGVGGSGVSRESDKTSMYFDLASPPASLFTATSWTIFGAAKFIGTGLGVIGGAAFEVYADSASVFYIDFSGTAGGPFTMQFYANSVELDEAIQTTSVDADTWTWFTMVRDNAEGKMRAYIGDTLLSESDLLGTYDHSGATAKIVNAVHGFTGAARTPLVSTDKLGIVPAALTAEQIAWLHNGGLGRAAGDFA